MSTSIDDLPISTQTMENISLNIQDSNIKMENKIASLQEERKNELVFDNPNQQTGQPQTQYQQHQMQHQMQEQQHQQQTIENSLNENINEFVTGIQQASASGMLNLPSRDIPQVESHISQDMQAKVDYIPDHGSEDYIKNNETTQTIINQNNKTVSYENLMNDIYENIHIPLLLSVLYFLTNLPIVNLTIAKILPFMFKTDGNLNIVGYFSKSFLFGLLFFIISYSIKYVSI